MRRARNPDAAQAGSVSTGRSLIVLSVVMWLAVSIPARAALGPAEHSIAHAAA